MSWDTVSTISWNRTPQRPPTGDLRLRGGNRTGARTDNKHLHHNGLIR